MACIAFRAITMHAMSDDASVHERPCIYCQVDSAEAMNVLEEGCDLASNEVLLVPSDEASRASFPHDSAVHSGSSLCATTTLINAIASSSMQ